MYSNVSILYLIQNVLKSLVITIINKKVVISRKTKQKDIIENEISKFNSFFNVEELYDKINKIDENIGIATVYRILKNLRENNSINHFMCDSKTIYSQKDKIHSHFKCEICGKQEHFKLNSLDFIHNKVNGDISHMLIDVYGVCNNCKNK